MNNFAGLKVKVKTHIRLSYLQDVLQAASMSISGQVVKRDVVMSGETFDPNSKKRPHPHHKLPSQPGAKGRASSLKAPLACKTLRNSMEHGESTAIKTHRVSPDITPLIWMHCLGNRTTEWSLTLQGNGFDSHWEHHHTVCS